jgi:enediyne biosynthesis protein E4
MRRPSLSAILAIMSLSLAFDGASSTAASRDFIKTRGSIDFAKVSYQPVDSMGFEGATCEVHPTSLDFGIIIVGSYRDTAFVIVNSGSSPLSGSVTEGCPDYSIVSGGGAYSLAPGESLIVLVRFAPTGAGPRACSVKTGTVCSTVSCTGFGELLPACRVRPTSLDFGLVVVGDYLDKTFTVTNVGGGMLLINVSEACVDYSIISGGGARYLSSGGSVTVTLRFEPTYPVVRACTVETGGSCSAVSCTGAGGWVSTWEDGTTGPLGDPGNGVGEAWGDYDNDGDQDLYISNYGGTNRLLRNDGAGSFTDATTPLLADAGNGYGVAWGDYDGDGELDLYLANGGTANKLFHNDGGGVFSDATAGPLGDTGDGRGVAWADYDSDGDLDLYLVNNGSGNKLFRNDNGIFADATSGPLGQVAQGRGAVWGDYDGDGDVDLYVVNFGSSNKLLRNDGGGTFVDVTSGPLGDPGDNMSAAWGDYDNDGDLDLYVVRIGANNKLLRNDWAGVFADATTAALAVSGPSMGVAWGDYDNDGDLDLYVTSFRAVNLLLRNDGGGVFVNATPALLAENGDCRGVACSDYDMDGDLDLYVVMNGANRMFKDNAPAYHWLDLRLVGAQSNTCAIGARARVCADGKSQIREVSGGSGYMSQNSMIVHFGLGLAETADTVEVRWPSGTVQDTTAVAGDQIIVMEEPVDLAGVSGPAATPPAFGLHQSCPNPSTGVTAIRYDLPDVTGVKIEVYDVTGRTIRVLLDSPREVSGRHVVYWDGCNSEGRKVTSGVYFCRLEAGGLTDTRTLILVEGIR